MDECSSQETNYSLTGDYANLTDVVDACVEFHHRFPDERTTGIQEARRALCEWIHKFHRECGTLTPQVEESLRKLHELDCVLIMTAHQPNLFAYGGVFRKATLNHVLAERLSESLDLPVVSFFGFADQDFTDDRWVRSALIPDVERRNGVLELHVPLPEKIMLSRTPKPSRAIFDKWHQDVQSWIQRKTKAVADVSKSSGVQLADQKEYWQNFRQIWGIASDAHDRAQTCADFNAFLISKIINGPWEYDTLFSRFSECQQIFRRELGSLIHQFRKYSQAVREAEVTSQTKERGVYSDEYHTIPFWYHCDCGSKARLTALEDEQGIMGRGSCLLCGRHYEIDFSEKSEIWTDLDRVSARALAMPLVFFDGLGICCYVGGVGGKEYLRQAKYVANRMGMTFPPIAFWRPHDRYLGLGQLEALLTLKQLAGSSDPSQCKALEVMLKEKLARTQQRVEELELCKKKIADSNAEQGRKISRIRALAVQQDAIRRENNFSISARHLGLLKNSERVMSLYPCIIDYAINIGLKNVREEWEGFLNTVGDLRADVTIGTKMDQQLSPLTLQSLWPILAEDLRDDRAN